MTTTDSERRLVDLMMDHLSQTRQYPLEELRPRQMVQPQSTVPSSDTTTFTIPQIASALFAIITVGGGIFAAWNGLTSKIETQKVSSDLIIEQMHKDIDQLTADEKDIRNKIDNQLIQTQNMVKELSNRVNELDNTVSQLYSRTSSKTSK